jgi:BASS family bile acid:Na+ symporter
MNTIFIVLPILTILMFDLGLVLKPKDFQLFVHRPYPVVAGLLGQIVVLPLLAWGICQTFDLSPLFVIGIMLVACSPGGRSSNVFSMLAGGDVALSVSLTALSSVVTLFTVPAIMAFVTQAAGTATDIHLPVGNLLVQNLVLMAVPVIAGIGLNVWREDLAQRLHGVLKRLAFPALVLLVTVFFFQHRDTIVREFASLGATMSLLIIGAMASGVVLSYVMRLNGRERRTIVIEIGMQNAAQAIAIASSPLVFNNDTIAIPAIIYALMMNIILIIYVAVVKNR